MKILTLGGSGTISEEVVLRARDVGHQVTSFNRGSQPGPKGTSSLTVDRYDEAALLEAVSHDHYDAVVDFLCFHPEHAAQALRCFRGKTSNYVFISSATVYEKPHRVPVKEEHPLGNPTFPYAQDKLDCENFFNDQNELPVTIVRPSRTFSKKTIPSLLHGRDFTVSARILAGQEIVLHDPCNNLWALTPAQDFAVALAGLLENPKGIGAKVHITSDEVMTWSAITKRLGRALGRKPKICHIPTQWLKENHPLGPGGLASDKAHQGCFDNALIKELVPGWRCELRLREALEQSVAWFSADPSKMVKDTEVDRNIDRLLSDWRQS